MWTGKNLRQWAAGVFVISVTSVCGAAPIAYDGFDYTAGNFLRNQGAWVNTGSIGSTPRPTIVSGSLSYPGLPDSTGNSVQLTNANGTADRLPIGTNTTGSIYFSLIVRLGSGGGNTGGAFFAGLDSNATGTAFANIASLYTRQDGGVGTSTDWNIGLRTGSANPISWSSTISPNTDVFIVGSFTFNGQSTLDLYTTPNAFPYTEPSHQLTAGADASVTSVVSFFLRQNTGEPTSITADELRIGTTWADVVPEPATLSVVAIGSLTLLFRRRRA